MRDRGQLIRQHGLLNNWSDTKEAQLLRGGRADLGAGGGAYCNIVCIGKG
jgi:hypothetical protein